MIDFLRPYLGELLTGLVALVLGWIGKTQTQKKADKADLTAKIQAVYKDMVGDADKGMDLLRSEIKLLNEKQNLQDEKWQKKLNEIEKTWKTKYSRLQTKYNNLLKKVQEYESKH